MQKLTLLLTLSLFFIIFGLSCCDMKLSFYNKHLSKVSSNLLVKQKADGSYSLFAKQSIDKGETIINLPNTYVFSSLDDYPRSYFFYELIQRDSLDNLAGRILYEKTFKEDDFFNQYYQQLFVDKQKLKNSAPFWDKEINKEYKKRLGYEPDNYFSRFTLDRKMDIIIERNIKYLNDYEPKFPEDMITKQNLEYAYALIINRAISFTNFEWLKLTGKSKKYRREFPEYNHKSDVNFTKDFRALVLLPFIDMIKTSIPQIQQQYNITQTFDVSNKKIIQILSDLGFNYSKETNEIMNIDPKDFLNNRIIDQLLVENPQSDQIGTNIQVDKGSLKLFSNKNYKKGEEIIYERGFISNNDYLIGQGNVKFPNLFDNFYIQLQYNSSKLQKLCQKIYCGVPGYDYTDFKFYANQVNHRFLNFLRIQMEIEENSDYFDDEQGLRLYRRNKFNNPYKELITWFRYLQYTDRRQGFNTTLKQDRADLKKLNAEVVQKDPVRNKLKKQIILYGIQQKKMIYKHLNCALRQWQKTMMNDILLDYQYFYVKKIVDGTIKTNQFMMHGFQE